MKNVKALLAAAVLSSLSFASVAAVQVQSTPAGQEKAGTISATAGTNLSSLEAELSQKADEMGAKSFRITSANVPNNLHGTAVIYK
ncbi:multiple stress resistance protein BhsA [Cronobacter turicensis]|uniref:multiple stress resistance protein BhsA n=1 Tax=Cronobacter turicensis TaxID=413502 RepID=UPI0035717574